MTSNGRIPQEPEARNCAATWASLTILIDGAAVTELQDRQSKSVRTCIFLPLYPLAEWLADNWWFLQSEAELPDDPRKRGFDRRHNLRWARGRLRCRRSVSCRWGRASPSGGNRWTCVPPESSSWRVDMQPSPAPCSIRPCTSSWAPFVERLDDQGLGETTLHEQWSAIHDADADEQEFCEGRCAARHGSLRGRLPAGVRDPRCSKRIRPELLDDFLSLANADRLKGQASALADASASIASDADAVDAPKAREAERRPVAWARPPGRPATASRKGCERV